MKMTKKILLAAVAVMAAFTFAGCDLLSGNKSLSDGFQHKSDEHDILKYTDNSTPSVWNIEGENATKDYHRGIQFLQTKHNDMAGLVRMNLDSSKTEGFQIAGVVGVLFNASRAKDENKKNVYNFCVAGVGKSEANPYYYVSYFANIKEDELSARNFGATKVLTTIDPDETEPYEIRYTLGNNGLVTFSNTQFISCKTDDNVLTVVIDVDEQSDGSYSVNFYDKEAVGKNDTLKIDEKTLLATVPMSGSTLGRTGAKQTQCGCYAMINKDSAMKGSLTILDLTHEATPVEE